MCLTSLYVFRDKDLQLDGGVFDQLLRLAIDFAQAVDLGYTTAVYSVAACAHDMVQRLRREGFIRVATIPGGVRIAGVGLCDNFFMVKSLSPTRPVSRSLLDSNDRTTCPQAVADSDLQLGGQMM